MVRWVSTETLAIADPLSDNPWTGQLTILTSIPFLQMEEAAVAIPRPFAVTGWNIACKDLRALDAQSKCTSSTASIRTKSYFQHPKVRNRLQSRVNMTEDKE